VETQHFEQEVSDSKRGNWGELGELLVSDHKRYSREDTSGFLWVGEKIGSSSESNKVNKRQERVGLTYLIGSFEKGPRPTQNPHIDEIDKKKGGEGVE